MEYDFLNCIQKEEFQHTAYTTNAYVALGPLGQQVLQGKKMVNIQVCCGKYSEAKVIKSAKRKSASSNLEFRLDELRKELASLHGGMFPHSILSTQQISVLAAEKPNSIEQLEKMIGKVKTGKYGSKILEEIANYCDSKKLDPEITGEKDNKVSKRAKTCMTPVLIDNSDEDEP
ncbi:hypothetical protein BVRB_5g108290 isoform D [Beta vulgaris subsp. vulgaris]|nr:hypothetical protein BVRB_5g108290 isoform D [Beta vulgaris subsp. vulgaris]